MMQRHLWLYWFLMGLIAFFGAPVLADAPGQTDASEPHIAKLTIDGAIGPASRDYLIAGMEEAREQGARAIILQMDTPGGLDAATRDIVQEILGSPLPVITYVHPSGARAASAGTYILYASHLAAMSPATTLGAATPVQMGGGNQPGGSGNGGAASEEEASGDEGNDNAEPETAMERKVINDSVAFIRGLANRHNRNADWAEQAVRRAVSLTAEEALQQNVVEVVAKNLDELVAQADGRVVQMSTGSLELDLQGLPVVDKPPSWRHELLSLITNPQIAYILLLIGIYGLIFEGYSPGAMVPGIVGVICLLTALYALQVLPVNYAGLALIIVGALLIASEAFVPSFGILGIGGVAALVIGSIILMDTEVPEMMVSRELIGAIGAVSGLLVLGILLMVGRSLRMPRVASRKALVGRDAVVAFSDGQEAQVRVGGELWQARSNQPLQEGQQVTIIEQNGLSLTVKPLINEPQQEKTDV